MNKKLRLNIHDLSGNPKYKHSTNAHLTGSDIMVIVYDITNIKSWQFVKDLFDDDHKYLDTKSIINIVGNKLI